MAPLTSSRRAFLKEVAGAGLVFVGCGLGAGVAAQPARSAGTSRRRVVVKGRRIKTVDVHAHCAVTKASALLRPSAARGAASDPLALDGQGLNARLSVMD